MSALTGVRVLVTRPVEQAEELCRLIEAQGGIAVRFPTIAITATNHTQDIQQRLTNLDAVDWLIFVSRNAVNFALKANNGKITFNKTRIAAIGKATAEALNKSGLNVDLVPSLGFDSEALLMMPELQQVKGQSVLIVRGVGGRETLASVLTERGAMVEYLDVYQRIVPNVDDSELCQLLTERHLNILTATSGEVLENLLTMVTKSYHSLLFDLPLIVVSDRIKQLATDLGFKHIAISSPSNEAILKAIISEQDNRGRVWLN